MPKIIGLCEKSLYDHGEQSSFKPGKSTFLLCEILGENSMTEETKTSILNTDAKPATAETKPAGLTEVVKPVFKSFDSQPAKEVKAVAEPEEVKDPMGQFDYTGCQIHVVQDGESLFDVAQKYGVALQQLRYFNHVNKATLKIRKDQKLYIPKEPVWIEPGE